MACMQKMKSSVILFAILLDRGINEMQIHKFKIITMLRSLRHSNHLQMLLLLKLTVTAAQLLMLGYQTQKPSLWERFATTILAWASPGVAIYQQKKSAFVARAYTLPK